MTTTFGPEFQVNTTTLEGQDEPGVSTLADGRFVDSWTDFSQSGGDTSNASIRAQVFNADGSKAGAEFLVNTTTQGNQVTMAITTLSDGNFVIGWRDGSQSGGDTTGDAIRAQIFNATGQKIGSEFLVNTITKDHQFRPEIAALADGRFVMTWSDDSRSADDLASSAVRGQVFNADGSKSGAEFRVNTTTVGQQNDSTVAALANGGFVVTWIDKSASGGDQSGHAIRAQVFAADGSLVGTEFLVNTGTNLNQSDPAVTALADGGVLVAWVDEGQNGSDSSGSGIRAQVFLADGSPSGAEFQVNTTSGGNQVQPQLTTLPDGRVLVSWRNDSQTAEDTSGPSIRAQILDPRSAAVAVNGTDLADHFFGTGFADRLSGGQANDTLRGAGGNDLLRGDAGNDALQADGGNDRVLGGAGDDRLLGGSGNDVLKGEDGRDSLSGGAGSDQIFGGKGADQLTGGAGADDFIFASAAEAKGDRITDFQRGVDDIHLRGFMKGGEFIGARAFTKDEDQVRYVKATGLLQGDVNGDGTADWSLTIVNKVALSAGDFIF